MKRIFFLALSFILAFGGTLNAFGMEKRGIEGSFSEEAVLESGAQIDLRGVGTLLFLNGDFAYDCEVVKEQDANFLPIRAVADALGYKVDWNGSEKKAAIKNEDTEIIFEVGSKEVQVNGKNIDAGYETIIYKNMTYVPFSFLAETLKSGTMVYANELGDNHKYYYDTQMPITPENSILRNYNNIIIDKNYDETKSIPQEEAIKIIKETCLTGLENFKKTITENLETSGENKDRFDSEFKSIETEINRMLYIGTVSKYYTFAMGPYDVIFDRFDGKIYFRIYSSSTIIKEVDVNDKSLFISVFIVG